MANGKTSRNASGRGFSSAALKIWLLIAAMLPAIVHGGTDNNAREMWLGGKPNAQVKIEVFSDYQCPHCRAFYLDTIKPLIADFTREDRINNLYIVYHDLPLDMHIYARKAASYALAAERLGHDTWLRVSDALYQDQAQWAQDGNIEAVVSKVLGGAELDYVKRLASDPSIDQAISTEIMYAQSRQIRATPTFFVATPTGREERVSGAVPYEVLKNHIEQFLK